MKLFLLVLIGSSFCVSSAFANYKCLEEAKFQARAFSAKENRVPIGSVNASRWFFAEKSHSVLYYGILLDNNEAVNVGLREGDCTLAGEPNYVTSDF